MSNQLPWQPDPQTAERDIAYLAVGADLDVYAAGFREGAEALLEVIRDGGYDRDSLVYPILYNLRHAVELSLKKVIWSARRLMDEPGDFPDGHRLDWLWNTCEPILRRVFPQDQSYATMARTVDQLCQLDPAGEGFRYPLSSKEAGTRSPTLDPKLRQLDLGALFSDVVRIVELLDGADFGMDFFMDAKAEMRQIEREMRAEYEAEMRAEHEAEMRQIEREMRAEYEAEMKAEFAAEMRAEYAADMRGEY